MNRDRGANQAVILTLGGRTFLSAQFRIGHKFKGGQKCPPSKSRCRVTPFPTAKFTPLAFLLSAAFVCLFSPPSQAENAPLTSLSTELTAMKGLDVAGWNGTVRYARSFPAGGDFISHYYNKAELHALASSRREWKLSQKLELDYARNVNSVWSWAMAGEATDYLDQAVQSNRELISSLTDGERIRSGEFRVGGIVTPLPSLNVELAVGPVIEDRPKRHRGGVRTRLVAIQELDSLQWSVEGWVSRMSGSTDHDLHASMSGSVPFSDLSGDDFSASYLNSDRLATTIFSITTANRLDENLTVNNRMYFGDGDHLSTSWTSRLTRIAASHEEPSGTRRDSDISWTNRIETMLAGETTSLLIGGGLDAQQQQYSGSLSQGKRTELELTGVWHPIDSDSIKIDLASTRYRYDTPSTDDFNDRDELRHRAALSGSLGVTPEFSLKTGIAVDFGHIVYLSSRRSAENRWTRLFEIFAEAPWATNTFNNRFNVSVASHYTAYDYQPYEVTQSRVFRTFSSADTLTVPLTSSWRISASLAGEIEDNGGFSWKDWTENIAERGTSHTASIAPRYNTQSLSVAFGWLVHQRRVYTETTSGSHLARLIQSDGPFLNVASAVSSKATLDLDASLLSTNDTAAPHSRLIQLYLVLRWAL